ncbi:MAG: DUF11 domain-containing protein, partial [Oscillochloris sp.]|nr:DUF11 domain-containing protein [Oscillochloris sp.]
MKVASASEATPGQNFSYTISVITAGTRTTAVSMSDTVNANLEVLSVSTTSGSCMAGQTVTCSLDLSVVNTASVTIQVKVRTTATSDTIITNVATADGITSRTVSVRIVGSAPTNTPLTVATVSTSTSVSTSIPTSAPTSVATTVPTTAVSQPQENPPSSDETQPEPTVTPPPPPPPPTPEPTALPASPTPKPPTPRPVVRRPTVSSRTSTVSAESSTPSSIPVSPTATDVTVAGSGDIFFRLASDWGSAYPGQQVSYTLVIRNSRAANPSGTNDMRNLTLRSMMPNNLEVLGANADRGADPAVAGNEVRYTISQLAPGEGVELTIATRIKSDVSSGTLLVAQSQAQYDGVNVPVYSNIVNLLVVGTSPAQAVTVATATSSKTTIVSVTAAATETSAAVLLAVSPESEASAHATATRSSPRTPTATAVATSAQQAPLPETSGGIPFGGVLLLGMTLMLRTWRLHRARERSAGSIRPSVPRVEIVHPGHIQHIPQRNSDVVRGSVGCHVNFLDVRNPAACLRIGGRLVGDSRQIEIGS